MKSKKIAIVYDWIDSWGGVERVLLTLHEIYPEAVFYTSYYDEKKAGWAKDIPMKTSFIQKLPSFIKHNRVLSLPFYPFAFETFNFSEFDTVISVSSSFAKGIVTKPTTFHLAYVLTPMRYVWIDSKLYLSQNPLFQLAIPYMKYLKTWDTVAARRPDKLVSISRTVQERCQRYYGLESDIIYPPFDIDYWKNLAKKKPAGLHDIQDFYLVVSRLEPYKKVDLVLEVFKKYPDKNLILVGEGRQKEKLMSNVASNTHFLSKVSDEELSYLYTHAKALVMPQEEDFGYVALEAQALGCPVIAYKKGGACETIEPRNGIFFDHQTVKSLSEAVERFHTMSYNGKSVSVESSKWLEKFSKQRFVKAFKSLVVR
ncbi:MAG: glycosyltransferase [bacterium]|nr:glycosyltransferase [bacterium]